MKNTCLFALSIFFSCAAMAQNPAGNCFRADYDAFQVDGLRRYFDCGNDDMLNTGDELTVEIWLQFRDLGDNQKIIGKFGLNNSGYVLGVDQGRIYPEVWNPIHYEPLDGLMNPTAQHWQHLAMTFTKGDSLRTYINGKQVGATAVANNAITSNTDPLIIGIASWDVSSFQSFGNMDEVRIWDVARTTAEIQASMFMEMDGSEAGLVAYYNFNQTTGSNLPDVTGNGNTGTGTNIDASEWVASKAVIANDDTKATSDLHGLWNGLSFMDPRVASTTNGLTLIATGLDTADYAVFGHNDGNGTSTDNLETTIPVNFSRAARTWNTTVVGDVNSNVLFRLSDAAGSGTALDDSKPAVNYTLLYRASSTGTFVLAGKGSTISNGIVTFTNVTLNEGQYTIGVGDEEYDGQVGINGLDIANSVSVFPNPSNGVFTINALSGTSDYEVEVFDITGKQVHSQTWNGDRTDLDLSNQGAGMYILTIVANGSVAQKRLVIR